MTEIRIAEIKKNGRIYKVNRIEFKRKLIFVYGEVSKIRGMKTYHEKGFSLPLDDVNITKIENSYSFAQDLFAQGLKAGEEDGKFEIIGESGRKNRDVRIQEIKWGESNTEKTSTKLNQIFEFAMEFPTDKQIIRLKNESRKLGRFDLVEILDQDNSNLEKIENAFCAY